MVARVGSTAGGTEVSASEKRAEAGPVVQADEDQCADAGGEQPRQRHQAQGRAADAGRLHDQEGAQQGRAEQGADRGEAAGRRHDRQGHRRCVLVDQVHGQRSEAATDGDERRLGAEDGAEAQRGQGGQDDAGELPVDGWTATGVETQGRRVAAVAGQVADGQPGQQSAQHQPGQRPPRRRRSREDVAGEIARRGTLGSAVTSARKPYARAEIGMPRSAASSSAERYGLERMTATGSKADGPPVGEGSGASAGPGSAPRGWWCEPIDVPPCRAELDVPAASPAMPRPRTCRRGSSDPREADRINIAPRATPLLDATAREAAVQPRPGPDCTVSTP